MFKKISIATAIILGFGYIAIAHPDRSFQSIKNKQDRPSPPRRASESKINPAAIAILSKTLSNLDKTTNTGQGFDYCPMTNDFVYYIYRFL